MNGNRKILAITAVFCALAVNNSAHAVLIDGAWSGTTLDTTSGLTWVDISQTKSYSINMALNSTWMTDLDFKYATGSQVEQLFSNAGIVSGDSAASGAGAFELGTNLGISYSYFSGPGGTGDVGRGLYGYDADTNTAGWASFTLCTNCGSASSLGWSSIDAETDWGSSLDTQIFSSLSGYTGGQWLVYDANSAAAIPEPSTTLLMAAGLLGLGMWRHRRAYNNDYVALR